MSDTHKGFTIAFLVWALGLVVLGGGLAMVEWWMPYGQAKAALDVYSYSGGVRFFSPEYYDGVVARSHRVGFIVLLAGVGSFVAWRRAVKVISFVWDHVRDDVKELGDWLAESDEKWVGYRWLFWGLMIAGVAIRIVFLGQPVRADEATTFIAFASRPLPILLSDWSAPNNQIFHTACVHVFYLAFGNSLIALRMPAFIAGVLFLPIVYYFGKKFYSQSIGLLILSYGSMALPFVLYSTMGRGYTMLFCFSYILFLACQFLLRYPHNRLVWLIALFSSVAGFFTIPTMLYSFAGTMLWMGLSRPEEDDHRGRLVGWGRLTVFSLLVGAGVALVYAPAYIATDWTLIVKDESLAGGNSWAYLQQELGKMLPALMSDFSLRPSWLAAILFPVGMLGSIARSRKAHCGPPLWLFVGVISFCVPVLLQRAVPYTRVYFVFFPLFYAMIFGGVSYWLGRCCLVHVKKWMTIGCCLLVAGAIGLGLLRDSPHFQFKTGDHFAAAEQVIQFLKTEGNDEDIYISMAPAVGPMVFYAKTYDFSPRVWDLIDVVPQFQEGDHTAWIIVKIGRSSYKELHFQALAQAEYTDRAKLVFSAEDGEVYKIDQVRLGEMRRKWQYPSEAISLSPNTPKGEDR